MSTIFLGIISSLIDVEKLTIAAMMFVCECKEIKVDIQKIDEFVKGIFPNSKTIRCVRQALKDSTKGFSENSEDAGIEDLKKSDKTVKIMGCSKNTI